jgi:multiple antibiotic resistance protein
MPIDFALLTLATFAALFPIANPLSKIPVFVALTRRFPPARREHQMRMAAAYMAIVLWVTLFAGTLVLSFFGVTLYALRLAGGIVIARIGLSMLQAPAESDEAEQSEAGSSGDVAFTPLALPLLSGPGSMAVTIGMATEAERPFEYLAVAIGILLVAIATWLTFKSARPIGRVLGANGLDAMTRVMGFLLTSVGVQFVLTAIHEALSDPRIVAPVVQTIRAVGP